MFRLSSANPRLRNSLRLGWAAYSGAIIFVSLATTSFSALAVEGPSMAPALSPNFSKDRSRDRVLFQHFKPTRDLQRGDVVAFWTPHNPEKMAIKRVVGLPGDEVIPFPKKAYSEWLRKQAFGERVEVERFGSADGGGAGNMSEGSGDEKAFSAAAAASSGGDTQSLSALIPPPVVDLATEPSFVVPCNHVWVEGDNWRSTHDSNDYGPISQSLITGKALWILTPSRFGPIDKDPVHAPVTAARVKPHVGPVPEPSFYL